MELRQLQIFTTLAEELSFTAAARRIHTVQSNVTTQIKALENDLGVRLFDRLGRRVVLTEAGRTFQLFAIRSLNSLDEGKRAVKMDSEPAGSLRIGAPESVLTYRLPAVINLVRKRFPRIELVFAPHVGASVFRDLKAGKIDFGFHMCDSAPDAVFRSIRLYREEIVLVCDRKNTLARQRSVGPGDLSGRNLILTESGCAYRTKFDRILANAAIRPQHVTELSSIEAIKQCVTSGMGIAILPAIAVRHELRQRRCAALRWAGPSLDVATHLAWHRDKWMSPALAAFRDAVELAS